MKIFILTIVLVNMLIANSDLVKEFDEDIKTHFKF